MLGVGVWVLAHALLDDSEVPPPLPQDLPYGTMGDDEMRNLNIGCLQDDGVIFLWVTGEAWLHEIG